jgi:threonine dehydratase
VRRLVPPSPLLPAPGLSGRLGRPVWLKLENLQVTGSFKVRGAAACLLGLSGEVRERGVVTCSSGNHGRAVAWVARQAGIEATVCVPEWVDPVKMAAIEACGAHAVLAGASYDEAERVALRRAREGGMAFVPPFDDPDVAAGQGTVAGEILDVLQPPFEVAIPLSGGGLVAGMGAAFREAAGDAVTLTAVSAARADVMLRSLEAGRPVEVAEEETLAGALAGGIGLDNRITFPLVQALVDRHLRVGEGAIARAVVHAAVRLHTVVEGGGAVALAAALEGALDEASRSGPETQPPRPLVLVLSGGNVDPELLARLVAASDLS